MNKLEPIYEFNHHVNYHGKKLRVRVSEEYFDSVPRPIYEERKMLKEDIQDNGLSETIKLNNQGIVIDGHTRMEICEEIGWKTLDEKPITPKFEIREFQTKAEERIYVIKTNLMRRHLNDFQKIKLAFALYDKQPNGQHTLRAQNRYDILLELKKHNEPIRASVVADAIKMMRQNVWKLLEGLVDDFCVRKEEEKNPRDTGKAYLYSILPKGEEVLSKGKPERITIASLGKSIGVGRARASQAIFLMNHANDFTLKKLENGEIAIWKAYHELTKKLEPKNVKRPKYMTEKTKVICPKCKEVSYKQDWKIAKNDGTN